MERIKYVDSLKFVAIFSILLVHFCGVWSTTGILNVTFDNIKEIYRFGVPLFLMITGMLTLNRDIDLKAFFRKKTVRIVYPLIFFLIIGYAIGIFNAYNIFEKFWYCWLVIGVYLAIPLVNVFVKHASEREIEYAILLFVVATAVYYLFKILELRIAIDLSFFITPISYLILGYYLSRKEFNVSPNKMVLISLFVFIAITLLKIFVIHDYMYFNNHNPVDSRLNFTLPQIIQVASVFLLVKNLHLSTKGISNGFRKILESNYISKFIESVSRASYGIYMLHMLFILAFVHDALHVYHMTGVATFFAVIIASFALLVVTWLIILLLSKIPIVKYFSGYG